MNRSMFRYLTTVWCDATLLFGGLNIMKKLLRAHLLIVVEIAVAVNAHRYY